MDLDQILPKLFVGSCPHNHQDIDQLREHCNVTAVLNVQSDADLAYWNLDWSQLEESYTRLNVLVRRVPITDFDHQDLTRQLPECVEVLTDLRDSGHSVYVHCNAGINRSPSIVIAYLHWVLKWDLPAAIDHVLQRHRCDPDITAIQVAGAGGEDRRNST